jgi:5'-3' exonuclease
MTCGTAHRPAARAARAPSTAKAASTAESPGVQVHLVDATFELFRAHFGRLKGAKPEERSTAATIGLIETVFAMLRQPDVTHVACATDHVIRSWRNDRYPGYKDETGVPRELLDQFGPAEDALRACGITVWAMVEFEADDALGAGAARYADDARVERVIVASPDKDMAQCVREDGRVVMLDRRKGLTIDADGVRAKFGVDPESIPDWLALVGDSSDGYPGLPGWGATSASAVLRRWRHLEDIPEKASAWQVPLRNSHVLAAVLRERREEAFLYRELATLRKDAPIEGDLDDLEWRGVDGPAFEALLERLGGPGRQLRFRVPRLPEPVTG